MDGPEVEELALFWGKARQGSVSGPVMHPLMAHMLDVAAVAMALPLAKSCGLDLRLIGFLVALHDLGKLSPAFQRKVLKCCPAFLPEKTTISAEHTAVTAQLLTLWFDDEKTVAGSLLQNIANDKGPKKIKAFKSLRRVLNGISGHHGRPIQAENKGILEKETVERAERLTALFLTIFKPPLFEISSLDHIAEIEWKLAALTIQADWIGSRQEWFPYVLPEVLHNPEDYFLKFAVPQAKLAVAQAGLSTIPVTGFKGIKNLFPVIRQPSPLQDLVETTFLPEGPVLVIIEDMTGSGKTEAALTIAHRLMEKTAINHENTGLFVGLPTMATANAMYERLAEAYQKLFVSQSRPSLALAHGRADLYEHFQEAIAPEEGDEKPDSETAESYCTSWLGSESRRALMAQVGVGTIDQALLSILPVRHTTIRQAGLAHKVLLVDECHAFDSYMTEEIYALLRFHAASGGSAILLSATLTKEIREKLVNAFNFGLGDNEPLSVKNDSYPLVTLIGRSFMEELPCDLRAGLARNLKAIRLNTPQEARAVLCKAFHKKAACCWIRNTVDDVIETARELSSRGEEVMVFHARFAMIDRLDIEKKIIRQFGKESEGATRAGLLIASQVIEQSLDLDFDVLCTDLAPMDLILQRIGRLRRHERQARPVDKAEFFVLSPDPVAAPDRLWIKSFLPGTAAVYGDPSLLWRTARVLFGRDRLSLPEDMRRLIEEVADRSAPGAVPSALESETINKEGDNKAAARLGRHNVLHFSDGYNFDKAPWGAEEKTPTRLEISRYVTVRLAYEKDGQILPWAVRKGEAFTSPKEKRRAWSLSEVSVRQNRLAGVVTSPHLTEAIKKARSGWSRWECEDEENYFLLVLTPRDAEWQAEVVDGKGRKFSVNYGERYGLEINKK